MLKRPIVLAGGAMLLGYLSAWARGMKIEIPEDLVRFMQAEQRQKLGRRLWKVVNN
jgi:hypothetical protein